MNRRTFLKVVGSAALLPALPHNLLADTTIRRVRPSDPGWPSADKWKQLNEAVGGNLIPVDFPIADLKTDATGAAAQALIKNVENPYYVGEQPGLTESFGWVDAWATKPSVHAVAARNAGDIAQAVKFARENNLRLAIKGGGHSYQGTSNAPNSLLIWTRHMKDIQMHSAFVPNGCERVMKPQPAVTVGAGTIGKWAYQAVTTEAGKYVQGGGCLTVGLAGLVQGGGFGSLSKHYGTAAGSLLEAEVVTADGQIRIANACTNPDLFWALKGGGGGTFGVVSKMTLLVHDLPEYFGPVNLTIKAGSDDSYRRLIRQFLGFYREHLFNDHWGEQAQFTRDNRIQFSMMSCGLDMGQVKKTWQPLLDWVANSDSGCSVEGRTDMSCIPARHYWDSEFWKDHWPEIAFPRNGNPIHALVDDVLLHVMSNPAAITFDNRPGASPENAWWKGQTGEVAAFWWGYESLWLPSSLLSVDAQQHLADALFDASRHFNFALHFNKGLGGSPPEALALAKDTCTNPAVLDAFALVIAGAGQQAAYPGVSGHEPDLATARKAASMINQAMDRLRAVAGQDAAYVSESNYFQKDFQRAYWGSNYPRLAEIKKKYDPDGLFIVHNGVGSEGWSRDGFTKL
jgi:FAD/FMN-containing dehydrogenase